MSNDEVVDVLNEIADLLDIKSVQFKPRAYRRAAREIESLSRDLEDIQKEGKLEDIPSVGKNISEKITELLQTGELEYLNDLREEIPLERDLLKVRNLGPKKAKKIWENLGVTTINGLQEAIDSQKIRKLEGFGEKSEENIKKGLKIVQQTINKNKISDVLPIAREIKSELKSSDLFEGLKLAGSLRRRKYLIGDIDILATTENVEEAMNYYTGIPEVTEVLSKGETKSSVRLKNGMRVDLRVVDRGSFGAAAQYFTGSQEHNVRLRELAISKGYKLSEYGLFTETDEVKVTGRKEEEIYEKLDLSWITPELREDRGEINAAKTGDLPTLVKRNDIKGDLHCHSARSGDSKIKLPDLAKEAQARGYEYLAVTDHADAPGIISGLTDDSIEEHLEETRKINERYENLELLAGVEANIQPDGTFRLSDSSLSKLDIVLAGIHSNFDMPEEKMTTRLLRAINNKNVNIIAHPTGRKVGERGSFSVDWSKIFEEASATNTVLEINASPSRFDLDDKLAKQAIVQNVKLSIGTDAHQIHHLDYMEFGLYLARRGWCEKTDLLNTFSLSELKTWLKA